MPRPQVREYQIRFTERGAKNLQRETSKLDRMFAGVGARIAALGTAAVAAAGSFVAFKSIQIAGEFEALRVRLENMFGSVEKGRIAFERFRAVAATTPFAVREVVEAGAALKAFGLDAENTIKITGDLAAFMGVSIPEAASALGRAFASGAGAADIFRERGILNLIKMKQNIDDFKNLTLEEFRQAMFKTFTDPTSGIAGATDKLAKTFQGAVSNFNDAIDNLAATIGEKLLPLITPIIREMTEFIGKLSLIAEHEFTSDGFQKRIERGVESFRKYAPLGIIFDFLIKKIDQTADSIERLNRDVGKRPPGGKMIGLEPEELESLARAALLQQQIDEKMMGVSIRVRDDLIPLLEEIPPLLRDQRDEWDTIRFHIEGVSGLLADAFVDQWRRGENALQSFLASFIRTLERMVAEIAARAAILGIVSAITGVPFVTLAGANSPANPLGGVLGAILNPIFGLQGGASPTFAPASRRGGSPVTIVINTTDPISFEQFLRQKGGAEAIARTLPELV